MSRMKIIWHVETKEMGSNFSCFLLTIKLEKKFLKGTKIQQRRDITLKYYQAQKKVLKSKETVIKV